MITKKGGKAKARLVVRGFEEDFIMLGDSPTVGKGDMSTVLAIAASMKWVIKLQILSLHFYRAKSLIVRYISDLQLKVTPQAI